MGLPLISDKILNAPHTWALAGFHHLPHHLRKPSIKNLLGLNVSLKVQYVRMSVENVQKTNENQQNVKKCCGSLMKVLIKMYLLLVLT